MTRIHVPLRTLVLAACLLVAAAAAPVGGLVPAGPTADGGAATLGDAAATAGEEAGRERVATDTPDGPTAGNDTNWTVGIGTGRSEGTAGEAFASAVAAHDTALEGEIRSRAFDRRLAATGDGTPRASVIDGTVRSVRLRLGMLDARRAELRAAYRNGTISEGRYRVALTRLTVEARTLRRVLTRADGAAERLPRETRVEYGLENTTFEELRTRADAVGNGSDGILTGIDLEPNVTLESTAFERPEWNYTVTDGSTLNGTDWGDDLNGSDRHDGEFNDTTTDGTGNYTERRMTLLTLEGNVTQLDGVHDYLADRSDGDREVEEALACARDALDDARVAIDDARAALDADDLARADDRIADARASLTRARDCLEQARAALADDDGGDDSSGTSTPTDWRTSK